MNEPFDTFKQSPQFLAEDGSKTLKLKDNFADCIVIGAGAAGLMCASQAGVRGRHVVVLERAKRPGRKILMSGGGRCNFTNLKVEPAHFVSSNQHFCISALSRYTPADFIELVEQYQVAYHEKTHGQLFCDNKSKDILDILLAECDKHRVTIRTQCEITSVSAVPSSTINENVEHTARYKIETNQGQFFCNSLVIATGGLSIPSMGATGLGYALAEKFGLTINTCQPSLVPFTLPKRMLSKAQRLAGVSMTAKVSCQGAEFSDQILFTHKGISGPAILQISNYWDYGKSLVVDFLPTQFLHEIIATWINQGQRAQLHNLLGQLFPKRFVSEWLLDNPAFKHMGNARVQALSQESIQALSDSIHQCKITPSGTEGYPVAEVTRGGVDVKHISSKTFEARTQPGLYFIGEVLDVTGWLGGYNFQWAWASGFCAGQVV